MTPMDMNEKAKTIWLTEFKTCSCSEVHYRGEGLGYCQKHGTDPRRSTKIAEPGEGHYKKWQSEIGWAHIG